MKLGSAKKLTEPEREYELERGELERGEVECGEPDRGEPDLGLGIPGTCKMAAAAPKVTRLLRRELLPARDFRLLDASSRAKSSSSS